MSYLYFNIKKPPEVVFKCSEDIHDAMRILMINFFGNPFLLTSPRFYTGDRVYEYVFDANEPDLKAFEENLKLMEAESKVKDMAVEIHMN